MCAKLLSLGSLTCPRAVAEARVLFALEITIQPSWEVEIYGWALWVLQCFPHIPAACVEESKFSHSKQDVSPRAFQPTESLIGLSFECSHPTTSFEQETHQQKHPGPELLYSIWPWFLCCCFFFFFSFIKDQWTVLPVSVERGALTLALSGQMGTAFMTGMSQWTVGCKACLTPLLKETHSGIWHLSGPTVRIAVGGCLLQPYLLTIQVFVRCLWKCNL